MLIVSAILSVFLLFLFLKLFNVEPVWVKETTDTITGKSHDIKDSTVNFFENSYNTIIGKMMFAFIICGCLIWCVSYFPDNPYIVPIFLGMVMLSIILLNVYNKNKFIFFKAFFRY